MNKDQIRQYTYYFIIAILSIISTAFLPLIGSTLGLEWNYPDTVAGKIVWWTIKALMSLVNILIFYSFRQQAKLNIKDNENYKKANEICRKLAKKINPRSPSRYLSRSWLTKGTSIAIGTFISTIALTQAILTYDWVSLLSYIFTIIMGLIFGVLQMRTDEEYWTEEYLMYAELALGENDNGNN